MKTEEFKTQLFSGPKQWESGIPFRLRMLKEGGLTLYEVPAFTQWLQGLSEVELPTSLVPDECGQLYIADAKSCSLYRYDPKAMQVQMVLGRTECDRSKPKKLCLDIHTLWILEQEEGGENGRVLAYSRDHLQIKYIIDDLHPIDIDLDGKGNLYILDGVTKQILIYDTRGERSGAAFRSGHLKDPVALGVCEENIVYVLDREYGGFVLFESDGTFKGAVGESDAMANDLSHLAIDASGDLFVASERSGSLYQFDRNGSYVGAIQIPGAESVFGIAAGGSGTLYVGTDRGVALLQTRNRYTSKEGFYYTKTLDSGIDACLWHRLAMQAAIPSGTVLDVYYHLSDDPKLKERIDSIILDPKLSVQKKTELIESEIPSWNGPERNPEDMLFQEGKGRYLWLKMALSTFEEGASPLITEMKVFYPRISYLRYLPAIYQEYPESKEFLERFLSLFESVFYDLEMSIEQVFKYLDPESTPGEFLAWLSSWVGMALEEEWSEEIKRRFIQDASLLYRLKGTPEGIKRLIEIYTGKRPAILEYSHMAKPMVLSETGTFRLGIDAFLLQTPVRGFRLGDDAVLGRTALLEGAESPKDPFLPLMHRFMVLLDLPEAQFEKHEKIIRRILNDAKPAHTIYTLRNMRESLRTGPWRYAGVNTRVEDYRPIRIGNNAILGTNLIAYDNGENGGKTERRSILGSDTALI